MAVAIIAATASLALAPTLVTTAMADAGGVNHVECTHKGTGNPCEDDIHGKNSEITCRVHGNQAGEGEECL